MIQARVSRLQIMSLDTVSERLLREHPLIEWDFLTDTYLIPKDKPIWTWLVLLGVKDE